MRTTETYAAVGVSKSFSGVTVLDRVDLVLRAGEVHALAGENGSGKSTLIKVLAGVHAPTTGRVERNGERLPLASPADAQRAGLAVVYQDYQLFPDLDVATNVALASELPRRAVGTIDRRAMRVRARDVLTNLGLEIDPAELLRNLRLAEWKLVEIARALVARARFLILDEPTALLDRRDSETILALIERLKGEGVGIAFVTHRLDEALRTADRVTVLRDGKLVAARPAAGVTQAELVELIVGGKVLAEKNGGRSRAEPGEPLVELAGVRLAPDARPFDLTVHAGEIVGLTGLIGSGALELARALAGRRPLAGRLAIAGREARISSPAAAIRAGMGYIPEERATHGLVNELSSEVNISLASLTDVAPAGLLRRSRLRSRAERYARAMAIRAPSLRAPVRTLSGGNQQKVQLAKWLAANRRVLVIESPTHGVDVGAKGEIHTLLRDFVASGGAILVASTDIPEVLSIADRVAVFSRGELVHAFDTDATSHGEVLLAGTRAPELDRIEQLIAK